MAQGATSGRLACGCSTRRWRRPTGGKRKVAWYEVFAGEKAKDQFGNWLPDETVEAFRDLRVGIKGPLTTPIGGGIRSLNVALRQIAGPVRVRAAGEVLHGRSVAGEASRTG